MIEKIFEPQEVFTFIQKHAGLSDEEIYGTYNMGQDFAIFISAQDMKHALKIVKKHRFEGLDGGYIEKGAKYRIVDENEATICTGKIGSLQKERETLEKAREGVECGIAVGKVNIKEGWQLITYETIV